MTKYLKGICLAVISVMIISSNVFANSLNDKKENETVEKPSRVIITPNNKSNTDTIVIENPSDELELSKASAEELIMSMQQELLDSYKAIQKTNETIDKLNSTLMMLIRNSIIFIVLSTIVLTSTVLAFYHKKNKKINY